MSDFVWRKDEERSDAHTLFFVFYKCQCRFAGEGFAILILPELSKGDQSFEARVKLRSIRVNSPGSSHARVCCTVD